MKAIAMTDDGLPFVTWPEVAKVETLGEDSIVFFRNGTFCPVYGMKVATEGGPLPIDQVPACRNSGVSSGTVAAVGKPSRMFW